MSVLISRFPAGSPVWRLALPGMAFYALVMLFSLHQPFFWDGALHSKLAHWFLEHDFRSLIPPADLDSGHPPFFALYLAVAWKFFGRSLAVSHLAMLPFILGSIWQLAILVRRFLPAGRAQYLTFLLLMLEPTFLAQSTLVSADLMLVFFYLLGLTAILNDNRLLLFAALTGLGLISLRGLFAIAALGTTEFLMTFFQLKSTSRKGLGLLWPFVLAGVLVVSWYAFHHSQTGWWLSAPVSNWSEQRGLADARLLMKNFLVTGWRLLDFGRAGIWILLAAGIGGMIRLQTRPDPNLWQVFLITGVPLALFAAGFIPFTNPIGHRYFMVVYLLVTLMAAVLLFTHLPRGWHLPAVVLAALLLISGHLWVYPDSIAKGWDSSLAYWPYPKLQREVDHYLNKEGISHGQVGTAFPLRYGTRYVFLTSGNREFKEKDFQRDNYILQTNLSNDFSEEEQGELQRNWYLLKTFTQGNVYLRLYARKPRS